MWRITLGLTFAICACSSNPSGEEPFDDGTAMRAGSSGVGTSSGDGGSSFAAGSSGSGGSKMGGGAGAPSTSGSGGTAMVGGGGNGGRSGGGGGGAAGSDGHTSSATCKTPVGPGLPSTAPVLEPGVWKAINPSWFPDDGTQFALSIDVNPCNPAFLYLGIGSADNSVAGFFKSTDAGSTWKRAGTIHVDGVSNDHVDGVDHAAVDPGDAQHLYAVNGVTGAIQGFFVSTNGGETFAIPKGFSDVGPALGITGSSGMGDVYYLATDPTDFNHVLLSFHSPFSWAQGHGVYSQASGVLESNDGGKTWIVHDPKSTWATGHIVNFLYEPKLGIGDRNTWLLGTQGDGMWRTTDAGKSWNKVTTTNIIHGGGSIVYTSNGTLYATGADHSIRSTDNGATWTLLEPGGGYFSIGTDGVKLYTARATGPTPFITSSVSDGLSWTDYNTQKFKRGPYEMAFDSTKRILYAASWEAGLWALKVR